jgi:polar amino acid transport system substrate-binding protein
VLSRRRLITGVVAGTGGGLLRGACSPDDRPVLERIRADGAVRIGVSGEQPFSYSDSSGRITGQSPEVARAVLAQLGAATLEAVQLPFAQLLDGLLDGQYDLLAAGLSITPDRCARVAFSRPDFVAPTAFLVRAGNPLGLRTFGDVAVAGVPMAVLDGSVEQADARAVGVDPVLAVDSQSALVRAVLDEQAPVAALTAISLADALRRQPGSGLEVTGPVERVAAQLPPAGGFAFRPADLDLRDAFDALLAALQSSGEWLRLSAPFGFTAANLPPAGLTTAALCR